MGQTAVIYRRVSTEGQALEGVSLDAQKVKSEAWCLANDYSIIEIYQDAGLSGGRADNRPGLQAAIEAACRNKSALVVYSLSRLARSTKDTIVIGEQLSKAGADLVSLSEKIDTTSAAGKMIFRMFAVMAEFEKDQISERTKMALAYKSQCGERVGTIPYGWELSAEGNRLKPVPCEQAAIQRIIAMRSQGLSYRAIANELTVSQVPTKSGAARWSHTSVQSVSCRAQPHDQTLSI